MNREELIAFYDAHSAADFYIYGFCHRGLVYAVAAKALPDETKKLGRQSSKRGGRSQLRFRVPSELKKQLIESGEALLCGDITLIEYKDNYNRGEHFERLIVEGFGKTWHKDDTPFWICGDLSLNGVEIQIKFDGAEITNETAYLNNFAA